MSSLDTQGAPPNATSPQFYPVQFHPEFGYMAPAVRFRRKALLIGKGAVFGVIAGFFAALALSPDREAQVVSALSMETQAAGEGLQSAPVPFVAATVALPSAVSEAASVRTAARPAETDAPSVPAAIPTPVTDPAGASQNAKASPKPKKKIARQPQRERNAHSVEPDPRSAYAGPVRRYAEPSRPPWSDQRSFGFGW